MKASELRLDNWIADKDTGKVFQVYTETFADIENGHLSVDHIPLTEEWLIKFGFERQMFGFKSITTGEYRLKHIGIHKIGGPHYQHEVSLHGRMHGIRIEYVHQLQNLYFALTGEELTVKETNG